MLIRHEADRLWGHTLSSAGPSANGAPNRDARETGGRFPV